MATLLVSGCAPPMPSICRASGDPNAASSTRSRTAGSAGRSSATKYAPFDVPPRIITQRMAVCALNPGIPPVTALRRSYPRVKRATSR